MFLVGLSSDMNTKRAIIKYLQGKPKETDVERIFDENIENWRDDFSVFLSSIDGRTMHCMGKIGEHLDSNSWKINVNNPIQLLSQRTKDREELFFGSMLKDIQKNENRAQYKIREALRCKLVKNMIR